MKEQFKKDLEEIFFNADEFAETIEHINGQIFEELKVIWDEKTEIIFDEGGEFGDSNAFVPSFIVSKREAENIDSNSFFVRENREYGVNYIEERNDIKRIYLNER